MSGTQKDRRMVKRNTRANRRQPARRPIPASALVPRPRDPDLTDQQRVDGWAVDSQIRIRQARPADVVVIRTLTTLAGVELEDAVAGAVTEGIAGAALRASLRGGREDFTRHMAEQFFTHQDDDQRIAYLNACLVLVAEHAEFGIVGALVAYPPINVVSEFIDQIGRSVADQTGPMEVMVLGGIAIAKVKAVAVHESVRGNGVGSALLDRCRQIYTRCGYMIVYGQMPPTPGLDAFYRKRGFAVLDQGVGFDPWVVFGIHSLIYPQADERMFVWERGPGDRIR